MRKSGEGGLTDSKAMRSAFCAAFAHRQVGKTRHSATGRSRLQRGTSAKAVAGITAFAAVCFTQKLLVRSRKPRHRRLPVPRQTIGQPQLERLADPMHEIRAEWL